MLTRIVRGSDYSPAIAISEDKDIFRGITRFERLMAGNNPDIDLVMKMCVQSLVKFCQFILKILSLNQILTKIKGRNPVANLLSH